MLRKYNSVCNYVTENAFLIYSPLPWLQIFTVICKTVNIYIILLQYLPVIQERGRGDSIKHQLFSLKVHYNFECGKGDISKFIHRKSRACLLKLIPLISIYILRRIWPYITSSFISSHQNPLFLPFPSPHHLQNEIRNLQLSFLLIAICAKTPSYTIHSTQPHVLEA